MAFLGLSGDTLTFLGGVAEGTSKTLSRQIAAQQDAIKEASSTMIRSRLAGRKKYDENIEDITKEIKPLLAQFNINDVASLMKMPVNQRNLVVKQLATVDGKDARSTFFKTLNQFKNTTALTESELINSLVPAYKESKMNFKGLVPRTFADVLFDQDPSNQLESRVKLNVGADRNNVNRTDLSSYNNRLNVEGKIKIFSKDASDMVGYTKNLQATIFAFMGGTKVQNMAGGFRDEELKQGDLLVAGNLARLYAPLYNRRVRELQVVKEMSLKEAESFAKSEFASSLANKFSSDDYTGNNVKIRAMTGQILKTNMDVGNTQEYKFLKGDARVKTSINLQLLGVEKMIYDRMKENTLIPDTFYNAMKSRVRKILSVAGYNEEQIIVVQKEFAKRVALLRTD